MRFSSFITLLCILPTFLLIETKVVAQRTTEIPKVVNKNGHYSLYVDGEPYFIFGAQAHNSSTWESELPEVWETIDKINANTLEIPVYWEQIEAQQGEYDFSIVQLLLDQARENDKRLILLWFATWKNGSNHYMPQWMKLQPEKYPNIYSKDGKEIDSPSPHAKTTMEADAKAFSALMQYLKKYDSEHTVIMVQVQNEPGSWWSVRDYSETAQKIFNQSVPEALLKPEVLNELHIPAGTTGSWEEVFGNRADEYFQAWSIARYIEYIAAAGKAVNPLPLYVNAALRDPFSNPPATNYESGGPTDNVIPIWKVAAPSLDLLAPDIYLQGSKNILKVIDLYTRKDNALMVPEIGTSYENIKYLYKLLEKGIGYAPFGIDNGDDEYFNKYNKLLGQEYKLLVPMMQELIEWRSEGRIYSCVQSEKHIIEDVDLENWNAHLIFGEMQRMAPEQVVDEPSARAPMGKALIMKLSDNEFLVSATNCRFTFVPTGKNVGKTWQYLQVEEGYFQNGKFNALRILNGDETDWGGPYIGETPKLLRISLTTR
jgi:hypothetical protein